MNISKILPVLAIVMLLILSVLPTIVVSEPEDKEPPVKKMDPIDDYKTNISATINPPILDGVISSSENWYSYDYIGNVCVAKDPNPVAKVYMTVEIDTNGTYQNLWIGIQMISPNYLEPGEGQWLRIDWDQDGVLDYEDHTGWNCSDGKDTNSGAEWMIPWAAVRVNPSKTPYQMNFSVVDNCFDILIHIQIFGYNATSEEHEKDDNNGNETEKDNKKDKENKTKGYEKDKKNKNRCVDDNGNDTNNNDSNENNGKGTSESATFPPRPNAGPFLSTTICAWTIPDGCQYDDDDNDEDDDDVYDPDDDRDPPDGVDDDDDEDDEDDEDDGDDEDNDKDVDDNDDNDDNEDDDKGKTKGPNDNDNKTNDDKNKTKPDKPKKNNAEELTFGIFDGDYLYFEYNLSAELLKNIKMYNISVFEAMHIFNASFNKEKVSNNLFKGDGNGAKLLGHDNPVALVQVLGRGNLTIMLNITDGWTVTSENGKVTLTSDDLNVTLRSLGRPSSSYIKVTNDQLIVVIGKGSQLQLRVANVSTLNEMGKSELPGCLWFEETQDMIFDNIGFENLGADATITGSDEEPNFQIISYLDGFNVDIKKIEGNSISLVLTSEAGSGNMVAISILKETLQIPENAQILVTLNDNVLSEARELTELTPDDTGFYRISDSEGEQVLVSVSEYTTAEISIQFIPEIEPDTTPLAEPWTLWDYMIVLAVMIVLIIAGIYMYVSRRED